MYPKFVSFGFYVPQYDHWVFMYLCRSKLWNYRTRSCECPWVLVSYCRCIMKPRESSTMILSLYSVQHPPLLLQCSDETPVDEFSLFTVAGFKCQTPWSTDFWYLRVNVIIVDSWRGFGTLCSPVIILAAPRESKRLREGGEHSLCVDLSVPCSSPMWYMLNL